MRMAVVAAVAVAVTVALLILEVCRWRVPGRLITPRQKGLRIASALLVITALVLMAFGSRALETRSIMTAFLCWSGCAVAALALGIIAILDIRELGRDYGEEQKRIIRDLAKPSGDEPHGQ